MEEREMIASHEQVSYIVNGLLTIIMFIGWYFIKAVISNQKEADKKIAALDKELGVNSANDKNHRDQFKKIEEWMIRLDTKIDDLRKQ